MPATPPDETVCRVLAAYGLSVESVLPIGGGLVNEHWDVWANGKRWVLRRYSTGRLPGGIPFEHELLGLLAQTSWPVAAPYAAPGDLTLVESGERYYALFPFLPGGRMDDPGRHGEVLARLHQAMSRLHLKAASGWPRLNLYGRSPFPDLVAAYSAADPEGAAGMIRHHGWAQRVLGQPPTDLPTQIVHGDMHTGNLLWENGRLSGVLDFDFARFDWRAVDVAIALHFLPNPNAKAAFLRGYELTQPLLPGEHQVLPALQRARELERTAFLLKQWRHNAGPLPTEAVRQALSRLSTLPV